MDEDSDMGHGKLRKFAENETFRCLLQPTVDEVLAGRGAQFSLKDHPIRGNWNHVMFAQEQPVVLELGCGRGEYSIDLAERNLSANYIGVDIKGARLWKGAKYATEHSLPNVAFLRTRIEFIEAFFAPEEVSEIWLTFSDPQLRSEGNRLTSPRFLERYRKFLRKGGIVHLKTDSRFLHEYSKAVCEANGLKILASTTDLYASSGDVFEFEDKQACYASVCGEAAVRALFECQTYYERMFLAQGIKITYLAFTLDHEGEFVSPGDAFDADHWRELEGPRRSFGHGGRQIGGEEHS